MSTSTFGSHNREDSSKIRYETLHSLLAAFTLINNTGDSAAMSDTSGGIKQIAIHGHAEEQEIDL